MAWAPDYCTDVQLKSWLRIQDAADDALLAVAITTASRTIDGHCGRQFWKLSSPGATRYYTWDGAKVDCRNVLLIDDLQTVTDLTVQVDTDGDGDADVTLTNGTDFDFGPRNATADGLPWTRLQLRPNSPTAWPRTANAFIIAAQWGWTAVPSAVVQATLLLAAEIFARRNAPFGVAGSPDLGSEMRLLAKVDPDVVRDLRRYVRSGLPGGWAAA